MGIDWRMGAEWFETCLLDYDPCSNYGNWTYGSGKLLNLDNYANYSDSFASLRLGCLYSCILIILKFKTCHAHITVLFIIFKEQIFQPILHLFLFRSWE